MDSWVTWKIAFRNLFLHKFKTAVIGFIIVFGTTLAIVGNSLVDAISSGMQRSLTNSVTGEIQIFSSDAKEKLSVFGNMDGSMPDVKHVNDFVKVRDALLAKVPNIQSVIPMGTEAAMWNPGNILDVKLEDLRALYSAKPRDVEKITKLKEYVRAMVENTRRRLDESRSSVSLVLKKDDLFAKAPANLSQALSSEFWASFDAHAEERIEFLANNIAPLIFDDSFVWLSYMGTVPGEFQKAFSQFEIVKGQQIPEGKRGFLFSEYVYENIIKNRVARRLDQVKKRIEKDGTKIAGNQLQTDAISACVAQAAEIYTQIAPSDVQTLAPKMRKLMDSKENDFPKLIKDFLAMNDSNFMERYKFFYEEIAPKIVLYKVRVGDVFPVTAFSDSGYSVSVNMKVYGTYHFKSFENSPIAGNFNIMDMMSFRELQGFMTAEKRQETKALEAEMGVADVGRDDLNAIFGNRDDKPAAKTTTHISNALAPTTAGKFEARKRVFEQVYSQEEMTNGVFLNAAVLLKDASKISQTLKQIQDVAKSENLGIQAIDWRDAAGMMGQLTIMVRAVLYFLVLITFTIATFIIMNSMLMATMERTREIGTMRAIGAQRKFLLKLFLQETMILSFIFGAIGTLVGALIVGTVGARGIPAMGDPAQGDVSTFFFSGDRLYFHLNPVHILVVFICMTLVAIISTQYPAWRAMKISPLEAILSKE
ncbi:FtsX-like permease family protein [bacterium]|nr:FtsX-like permease family protein [bacterium]